MNFSNLIRRTAQSLLYAILVSAPGPFPDLAAQVQGSPVSGAVTFTNRNSAASRFDQVTTIVAGGQPVTIEAEWSCSVGEGALDPPRPICEGDLTASMPPGSQLTLNGVSWAATGQAWLNLGGGAFNSSFEMILGSSRSVVLTVSASPMLDPTTDPIPGPSVVARGNFPTNTSVAGQIQITTQTNLSATLVPDSVELPVLPGQKVQMPIVLQESGPSGTVSGSLSVKYPVLVSVSSTANGCQVTGTSLAGFTLSCEDLAIEPGSSLTIPVSLGSVAFAPVFLVEVTGVASDLRTGTNGQQNKVSFSGEIKNLPAAFAVNDNFGAVFASTHNINPGSQVTQILTITATGAVATAVVAVTYGGPIQINSATSEDFACQLSSSSSVTCEGGQLDAGEVAQITIKLTAAGTGEVSDKVLWSSGPIQLGASTATGTISAPSAEP